ncbi:MAG TPA: ATP-dependent 6-phosphofructokinase [Burkholderiales bacterium]|nr:ATP-dependent 6-phosphofructokinase [Burkholderiales bacterium]
MSADRTAIGVLTSGGDAPGMNAAIRAVVRGGLHHGRRTIGVLNGYDGLIDGTFRDLGARDVGSILTHGGTMLYTRRCERFFEPRYQAEAAQRTAAAGIGTLVVIGGEGSIRGAQALAAQGVPVIAIPASIDNDVYGTDLSIGTDTALNTIVGAVDRLRDTASSHNRAFLVETMGRQCGYLAVVAGVVCGAELVLVPERPCGAADVLAAIKDAHDRGKGNAIIIVAEGSTCGIGELMKALEQTDVGFTARVTRLGHIQRGGSPSAFDRLLASRMGVKAVEALVAGEANAMVGLEGNAMRVVPLAQVIGRKRIPEDEYFSMIRTLAQ